MTTSALLRGHATARQALLALAAERGSTADTVAGARRFLLTHGAPPVLRPATNRDAFYGRRAPAGRGTPQERYRAAQARARQEVAGAALAAAMRLWLREDAATEAAEQTAAFLAVLRPVVEGCYATCGYRVAESRWAGGEHAVEVVLGNSGDVADAASGSTTRVWSSNGKWSGNNSTHTLVVSRDWLTTVHSELLAVVDNMLTLFATPVDAPAGYSAWAATWVEQGRGVGLTPMCGFIVRGFDCTHAHGSSVKGAISSLRRRGAPASDDVSRLQARVLRLRRHWGVVVTVDDSRAAGNCATGTRDWAERHADGARSATVKAVLLAALTSGDRVPLALAACERAVRSAKAARTVNASPSTEALYAPTNPVVP
jgi:hypothetical protein